MSDTDILAELAAIVQEITGISADQVSAGKSFSDDLDVDSLSMVEIATAAEDKFGVSIPDDAIAELRTVGDAVAYIAKAGVAA
jgi:acyl carrier protein